MYPTIQIVTTNKVIILYRDSHDAYIGISSYDSECGKGRYLFYIAVAIEYLLGGLGKIAFCYCYLAIVDSSMLLL